MIDGTNSRWMQFMNLFFCCILKLTINKSELFVMKWLYDMISINQNYQSCSTNVWIKLYGIESISMLLW